MPQTLCAASDLKIAPRSRQRREERVSPSFRESAPRSGGICWFPRFTQETPRRLRYGLVPIGPLPQVPGRGRQPTRGAWAGISLEAAVPHGDGYIAQKAAQLGALHGRLPEQAYESSPHPIPRARQAPGSPTPDEPPAPHLGLPAPGDSRGIHPGRYRSRRPADPFENAMAQQWARASQSSGRRYTGSHPSHKGLPARRWDRHRCIACNCHSDLPPPGAARGRAARARSESRPEKTMIQAPGQGCRYSFRSSQSLHTWRKSARRADRYPHSSGKRKGPSACCKLCSSFFRRQAGHRGNRWADRTITGPRIAGNPGTLRRGWINGFRCVRVVIRGTHDDGSRPRNGNPQRRSQQAVGFVAALQVLHLSCMAALDPGFEVAELRIVRPPRATEWELCLPWKILPPEPARQPDRGWRVHAWTNSSVLRAPCPQKISF